MPSATRSTGKHGRAVAEQLLYVGKLGINKTIVDAQKCHDLCINMQHDTLFNQNSYSYISVLGLDVCIKNVQIQKCVSHVTTYIYNII